MFGLMRAKKCGMSANEKHFRRMNYCGTCKTLGSFYGQKSRLMLNHDTVFLAEILTSLSGENVGDWQKSYQSYNCLNLPKTEMPVSLQFAAAANVILAEFKIADHLEDSRQKRFKVARKIFSKEFLKAEKSLKDWNFPLEKVREILRTQAAREAANSSLETLAEPTAAATALFFAHGVEITGRAGLKNSASKLGFAFGKLIYLLDAFEDFEKDAKNNQFNAIRSVFGLNENKIPVQIARKMTTILRALESEIIAALYELPITKREKQIFAARLQENLARKISVELPVLKTRKNHLRRQTFLEKYRAATATARNLAREFSWQMPFVFLFVFAFAFIAPAQMREAKSARECFDLSFNLMFLGAVFSSAAISLKPLFLENPEEIAAEEVIQNTKKKGKKAAAGAGIGSSGDDGEGGCCCCDCDDGCDCCCDCDSCGCDGCCDCGGCCDC